MTVSSYLWSTRQRPNLPMGAARLILCPWATGWPGGLSRISVVAVYALLAVDRRLPFQMDLPAQMKPTRRG